MRKLPTYLALTLGAALLSTGAHAAGDPKKGADVFAGECGDCHSP